ncbi:hypothetical protein ACODT5_45850 [Streptomyces sp. 5.8]
MSTPPLFRYAGPPELAEAVRPGARGRRPRPLPQEWNVDAGQDPA